MKRLAQSILSLSLVATLSGAALAQSDHDRGDYASGSQYRDVARVTRVEIVNGHGGRHDRDPYARQECWDEVFNRYDSDYYRDESGRLYRGDSNKTARTLIGALVGGALGNQVGGGDGRTAATIAGAAIGATVGNKSGRDDRYEGHDRYRDNSGFERRCRTVGGYGHGRDTYRVSYRYSGRNYQTVTDIKPGRTLRVLVDVRPE